MSAVHQLEDMRLYVTAQPLEMQWGYCLLLHIKIVPLSYIPQSAHSLLLPYAHIFLSIDIMFITDFNNLYAVSQISFPFSDPGFVV